MPPPPRHGLAQALSGVHPECDRFFLAYKMAHLGTEPTLEQMLRGVKRLEVPRANIVRDWRRLSGQVYAVRP